MPVHIQFINYHTDNIVTKGPFEFTQTTYDSLDVRPVGGEGTDDLEHLAYFDTEKDMWCLIESGEYFSDMVVS